MLLYTSPVTADTLVLRSSELKMLHYRCVWAARWGICCCVQHLTFNILVHCSRIMWYLTGIRSCTSFILLIMNPRVRLHSLIYLSVSVNQIYLCVFVLRSSRAVQQSDMVPQSGSWPHVHSSDRLSQWPLHSAMGQEETVHPGPLYRNADRSGSVSEWFADRWVCVKRDFSPTTFGVFRLSKSQISQINTQWLFREWHDSRSFVQTLVYDLTLWNISTKACFSAHSLTLTSLLHYLNVSTRS